MNNLNINHIIENSNSKTVFYIIRHGQSVGNLNSVCLGHTDLDLTELGYSQAEKTAKYLSHVDFSAIYSSDLMRAIHTAEPHARIRNMSVITDRNFRELFFGDWENTSVEHLKEKHYEDYVTGWRKNFGTFTAPNGESVVHMAERMVAELKNIASKHRGEKILVATHAAAIRALWGKINRLTPDMWAETYPFPTNASYSILEIDEKGIRPVSYSNDSHLGEFVTSIQP